MRLFIGYLLENESAQYYDYITNHLSQKFKIKNLSEKFPPHITFKAPFDIESSTTLESKIDEIVSKLKNQNFVINGFDKFEGGTIFLKIQVSELLIKIMESIISEIESFGENKMFIPKPFHPHISIARFLSQTQNEMIWQYLNSLPTPHFNLQFNNITIFKKESKKWKIQKTYRF